VTTKRRRAVKVVKRLGYCGGGIVARVIEGEGEEFYADLHEHGEKVDGFGPLDFDTAVEKWRWLCRKAQRMAAVKTPS